MDVLFNLFWSLMLHSLPQCATEDSQNCVWNAHTQGNHQGNTVGSFQIENKTVYFEIYDRS